MKRCVFLSMDNLEGFVTDDERMIAPLARQGWQVETLSWKAPVDWDEYDAVVIRSTWDYQNRLSEFLRVLEVIEASEPPLANPIELVRWNARKDYLFDLSSQGIEIVPTLTATQPRFEEYFDDLQAEEIVIKPLIGANADDTFRVRASSLAQNGPELRRVFARRTALVQPFLHSIMEEGEFSLIFLGGEFSHAILKTPRRGDFRVQEEHGGLIRPVQPEAGLLETGRQVMAAVKPQPLYARVDLVRGEGKQFFLMELELIEPSLYLRMDRDAPDRFLQALMKWMRPE